VSLGLLKMSVSIPLLPLISSSITIFKACANCNANRHVQQFHNSNCAEPDNALIGWGGTTESGNLPGDLPLWFFLEPPLTV